MNALDKYRGLAYLLAVVVLLPLLAWSLALSGTASQWRETRKAEKQLDAMRQQNGTSAVSAVALAAQEHISDGELLGDILCGPGCCEVVKYVPYVTGNADGLALHTAEIVLNTDYKSLVQIVDNIERTMPLSRLKSLSLRSVTPRGSNQVQLHAVLIIQQITENK